MILLIPGTSTWGNGELQDDWYEGIKVLKSADLFLKNIALFGCGDSESCCDTFCDDIGILYESLKNAGWTFFFLFHCCGKRYICGAYPWWSKPKRQDYRTYQCMDSRTQKQNSIISIKKTDYLFRVNR